MTLAACGGDDENDEAQPGTTATQQETEAEATTSKEPEEDADDFLKQLVERAFLGQYVPLP